MLNQWPLPWVSLPLFLVLGCLSALAGTVEFDFCILSRGGVPGISPLPMAWELTAKLDSSGKYTPLIATMQIVGNVTGYCRCWFTGGGAAVMSCPICLQG